MGVRAIARKTMSMTLGYCTDIPGSDLTDVGAVDFPAWFAWSLTLIGTMD